MSCIDRIFTKSRYRVVIFFKFTFKNIIFSEASSMFPNADLVIFSRDPAKNPYVKSELEYGVLFLRISERDKHLFLVLS